MSVIGYSLNDSIVVSDRIRENFRKIRRGTYEIFGVSLTQSGSYLITSGTIAGGDPDAVSLCTGSGRLLLTMLGSVFHRYGLVYSRGVRTGAEAREA